MAASQETQPVCVTACNATSSSEVWATRFSSIRKRKQRRKGREQSQLGGTIEKMDLAHLEEGGQGHPRHLLLGLLAEKSGHLQWRETEGWQHLAWMPLPFEDVQTQLPAAGSTPVLSLFIGELKERKRLSEENKAESRVGPQPTKRFDDEMQPISVTAIHFLSPISTSPLLLVPSLSSPHTPVLLVAHFFGASPCLLPLHTLFSLVFHCVLLLLTQPSCRRMWCRWPHLPLVREDTSIKYRSAHRLPA